MTSSDKKIIFGLGNPGLEYQHTRHNVGFMLLDRLQDILLSSEQRKEQLSSKLKSRLLSTSNTILVYPQTYMNLSGEAVRDVLNWYKITNTQNILVIHDDISLPLGRIRWVHSAGAAGQHGIESIIKHLGTQNFPRLRFGIGPDPGGERRSAFVLGKFQDEELLKKSLSLAIESLKLYLQNNHDLKTIMNQYNGVDLSKKNLDKIEDTEDRRY